LAFIYFSGVSLAVRQLLLQQRHPPNHQLASFIMAYRANVTV
jgi:hypothetical protein